MNMKWNLLVSSFLVLLIANQVFSSKKKPGIMKQIDRVLQIYGMASGTGDLISSMLSLITPEEPPTYYYELSAKLGAISEQLSSFRNEIKADLKSMQRILLRKLAIRGDFKRAFRTLKKDFIFHIEERYARFREINLGQNRSKTTETPDRFYAAILAENGNGLQSKLKGMYQWVHDNPKLLELNIFDKMNQEMQQVEGDRCDDPVSSQQYIHRLFTSIITSEVNALIVLLAAYANERKVTPIADNEIWMEIVVNGTRDRLSNYIKTAQKELAQASTYIFRCGPTDTSFIELKGLSQGIIMDDKRWRLDCGGDDKCVRKSYWWDTKYGDICMFLGENHCLGRTCYSELTDCRALPSLLRICPSDQSYKHYNYVEFINETTHTTEVYGTKLNGCNRPPMNKMAYLYKGIATSTASSYCDFCMCTCTNNSWRESDVRTFSNFWQEADISESKAVIGVRFVEERGMIHLQIKQGILQPYGKIQKGSEEWKPLPEIRRTLSANPGALPEYFLVENSTEITKLNLDFGYWHITHDWKTMSLSDMKLPDGYIVAGVGFDRGPETVIEDGQKAWPIGLSLKAMPYDFKSGKYVISDDKPALWLNPWNYGYKGRNRPIIKFDAPDVPTRAKNNQLYPGTDQVVTFRITDYAKDVGQTMIPFLDAQEIVTSPSAPLSGIGLYFKGQPGYGGFIAPRVLTYDVNNMLGTSVEKLVSSTD